MADFDTLLNGQTSIYDTLYLFTIFILPFLGYISSIIYSPESGRKWYKSNKFVLLDLSNSSYGLFFTLFIYLFAGMGIIYIANHYLGNDNLKLPQGKHFTRINDPLFNISKFWDSIILSLLPVGFLLIWISQPLMLQFNSLTIPGSLSIISTILFLLFSIYMIKIHWIIMILFLPLCIWCIYMSAFYFLTQDETCKANQDSKNEDEKKNKDDNKTKDESNDELRQP